MVDFHQLLTALYELQGLSDPSQPVSNIQDRMEEINDIASNLLTKAGWIAE